MRPCVLAVGTVVFMIGLVAAFCAGSQTHSLSHDVDWNYAKENTYYVVTLAGIAVASVGVGALINEFVFGNHEVAAGAIPKSCIVIGSVVFAFGAGMASWANLMIEHTEMQRRGTQLWSIGGLVVGLVGMTLMTYGFASDPETHPRKGMSRRKGKEASERCWRRRAGSRTEEQDKKQRV